MSEVDPPPLPTLPPVDEEKELSRDKVATVMQSAVRIVATVIQSAVQM